MSLTYGIDTSYWEEGRTNWVNAHASGIEFGVVRACNGKTPDSLYKMDVSNLLVATVIGGDYLEFNDQDDPVEQAHIYFSISNANKLPISPWIAFERANLHGLYSPTVLGDRAKVCTDEVEKVFNRPVGIYTGKYDWPEAFGGAIWGAEHPLWIAQYHNISIPPELPAPWDTWRFWQFSDKYTWPNGYADGNVYNGSLAELCTWLAVDVPQLPSDIDVPPLINNILERVAYLENQNKALSTRLEEVAQGAKIQEIIAWIADADPWARNQWWPRFNGRERPK